MMGIIARILMCISALITLVLGTIHFIYTFWGRKLWPRDADLQTTMSKVPLVISSETLMWKTWVAFNASHSLGLILYGLVYGYLALCKEDALFQSRFLLAVGFAFLGVFVVLAKRYLFSIPFRCLCISLACYIASVLFSLL
jgi:hypothetical protein